jgi:hypothetical protein
MVKHKAISPIVALSIKLTEGKREYSRIQVHGKATIRIDDVIIKGEVENLSLKGAYVTSDTLIEVGTSVIVTIVDTLTSQILSEVKAKVVRVTGNGIGLQFQ